MLAVVLVLGAYVTFHGFADWLGGLTSRNPLQATGQPVIESPNTPITGIPSIPTVENAVAAWSDGPLLERMRMREMVTSYKVAVKQVKAAQAVAARAIELKSTGADKHHMPFAVLSVDKGPDMICHVGDMVQDAEVMGIFENQVVLLLDGQRLALNVVDKDFGGPSQASSVEFVGDVDPVPEPTGECRRNQEALLGRTRLERNQDGFIVVQVDNGSPLMGAGIEKGDKLLAIDGVLLATRIGTNLAYENLTGKTSARIAFIRDGVRMEASAKMP